MVRAAKKMLVNEDLTPKSKKSCSIQSLLS